MPSISITSLCSYAELPENSISCLSWSFVKEFAVSSYRWSYAQLCMLTQDKSAKLWELHILGIELELVWSKVSARVCGFTFGSISLLLISKSIKEITKTMQNIYPDLMIKMLSGSTKNLYIFPDFSCMHRRMCVHAHSIPGRRNSWYVPGPSFIRVTFCCWRRTAEAYVFSYFWRKRAFASIII